MKTQKRTLTVLLVVMMILSSFSFAFAAETPSGSVPIGSFATNGGTITINASHADDTFALYKVVDITYVGTSNTVTYDFTNNVKAYIAEDGGLDPSIATYQGWATDSNELKTFLAGYASYVKRTPVTADKTVQANGSVATIKNVALGQYMVLGAGSSTGAYIYQIMTATFKPNDELNVNTAVVLESKSSIPTLTKGIVKDDGIVDKDSVAYGEIVEYKITVGVPTYPVGATNRTFVVSDVLPAGMTYQHDTQAVALDPEADAEATFEKNDQNLSWTFDFDKIAAATTITITYQAKAGAGLAIASNGNFAGNENTATLTYGDEPFTENATNTITDKAAVYTYGLDLTKVDAKDNSTKLANVEFEVYAGDQLIDTITTDKDGKAALNGLDLGTYTLKETKAATGYSQPIGTVEVTLTDSDLNGVLDDENETDGIKDVQITNTKGIFNLPSTGGVGTWVFTVIGILLLAMAAAGMLVVKRRQVRA